MSCRKTGYQGRTGLYEILIPNQDIIKLILSGGSSIDIKNAAVKAGMSTLRMEGLEKVKKGLTSIEEILAITSSEVDEKEGIGHTQPTQPAV